VRHGSMPVEFEVPRATVIEGICRAAEIRGDGAGASGECAAAAFMFDGTLA
jgi:hypothetical protein